MDSEACRGRWWGCKLLNVVVHKAQSSEWLLKAAQSPLREIKDENQNLVLFRPALMQTEESLREEEEAQGGRGEEEEEEEDGGQCGFFPVIPCSSSSSSSSLPPVCRPVSRSVLSVCGLWFVSAEVWSCEIS